MKVKKKALRKGQAQLPINYPAPDVATPFNYDKEKDRVETICKRLAEVEESVRDEVLAKVPQYLREITNRFTTSVGVAQQTSLSIPTTTPAASAAAAESFNSEPQKHLMTQIDLEQLSMIYLKLSYGLFYNFWHSDKPLVQHECAAKIVNLQHAIPNPQAADLFLRCFLRILVREWMKIDRWRLDKYMSLVRKLVFQTLRRVISYGENSSEAAASMERIITAFQQEVITEASVGLTMHICDVLLDELIRSGCGDALFLKAFDGIALFAMRRGNFVEKRVLDFVITPLASGVLEEKRSVEGSMDKSNDAVLRGAARLCEEASVAKGTAYLVRPMLSESAMLLRQAVELKEYPDAFEPVHKRDVTMRIAREIQEADEARLGGATARAAKERKRDSKRKDGARVKKVEPVGKAIKVHGKKKKVSVNAKSSKRKKIIKLSKKDLAAEDD